MLPRSAHDCVFAPGKPLKMSSTVRFSCTTMTTWVGTEEDGDGLGVGIADGEGVGVGGREVRVGLGVGVGGRCVPVGTGVGVP